MFSQLTAFTRSNIIHYAKIAGKKFNLVKCATCFTCFKFLKINFRYNIAEKEIFYLMSRGLTKDEATALIIRGFLDTAILHLPAELDRMIKDMTEKVSEGL